MAVFFVCNNFSKFLSYHFSLAPHRHDVIFSMSRFSSVFIIILWSCTTFDADGMLFLLVPLYVLQFFFSTDNQMQHEYPPRCSIGGKFIKPDRGVQGLPLEHSIVMVQTHAVFKDNDKGSIRIV